MRLDFRFLTWLCIALFLLAGLPLLLVEDQGTGRFLATLSVLFLGGFGLAMALDARQRGVLQLQHTTISRAARPRLFDAATLGIGLCGIGLIIAAVLLLSS